MKMRCVLEMYVRVSVCIYIRDGYDYVTDVYMYTHVFICTCRIHSVCRVSCKYFSLHKLATMLQKLKDLRPAGARESAPCALGGATYMPMRVCVCMSALDLLILFLEPDKGRFKASAAKMA